MIDSWLRGSRGGMSNLIVRATVGRTTGRESPVSIRTCPMRTWTFLKPLNQEESQKNKHEQAEKLKKRCFQWV